MHHGGAPHEEEDEEDMENYRAATGLNDLGQAPNGSNAEDRNGMENRQVATGLNDLGQAPNGSNGNIVAADGNDVEAVRHADEDVVLVDIPRWPRCLQRHRTGRFRRQHIITGPADNVDPRLSINGTVQSDSGSSNWEGTRCRQNVHDGELQENDLTACDNGGPSNSTLMDQADVEPLLQNVQAADVDDDEGVEEQQQHSYGSTQQAGIADNDKDVGHEAGAEPQQSHSSTDQAADNGQPYTTAAGIMEEDELFELGEPQQSHHQAGSTHQAAGSSGGPSELTTHDPAADDQDEKSVNNDESSELGDNV